MRAGHASSLTVLLVLACLAAGARAEERLWTGGGDGIDWFDPKNWEPLGEPAPSDELRVLSGSPETAEDACSSDGGSITVSGALASASFAGLSVGHVGTGTLDVLNTATVHSSSGSVGYSAGAEGSVAVNGPDSDWAVSGNLYVGRDGHGSLAIIMGGAVSNTSGYAGYGTDSSGTVTVDGLLSSWSSSGELVIGRRGTGRLTIANGASVSSMEALVGSLADSNGTVTVDGDLSTWTSSDWLMVGTDGSGTLHITNGGTVSAWFSTVGTSAGSDGTVTVEGVGSTWTNTYGVEVGGEGTGTLDISNGGAVSSPRGRVGTSPGSNGTVTVGGAGATWTNSASLHVGSPEGANGVVEIRPGGIVTVGGTLGLWPGGTVNLHGGLLRFAQGDPLDPCGGTLGFDYGTVEFDRDLAITGSNGTLRELFGSPITIPGAKTLSVTGTATLAAQVTLEGGTLSAADLVNGSLLQCNGGTLKLTEADLVVGPGGQFGWALTVPSAQTIDVTHTATVASGGQLSIAGGRLAAGEMVNLGQIELAGPPSVISTSTLTNHGFVQGDGTIAAALNNQATGQVSVEAGQRLTFTEAGNTNSGSIVNSGGTIQFSHGLTNTPGGNISGHGAAGFAFNGGLDNAGVLGLSFADARIYGDITNKANAILSITGASTATFAGDLMNNGNVFIGTDSRAVFQGHVSGAGSFPGGGTAEFVDGFSPGESPGVIDFGGDVSFGPAASLEIELANADNSDPLAPRYDALDVARDVELAGTLSLTWLPVPGDPNSKFGGAYSILSYGGARTGVFGGIDCAMAAYLNTSVFDDGIEYDDANGEVRIHLHDLLDGDADLDGKVAREDFAALQSGFAADQADWFTGDFTFDGRVDFRDYLTWKAHAGDAVPGGGKAPEPATGSLLLLGAALVLWRKRRRACLAKRAAPTINDTKAG